MSGSASKLIGLAGRLSIAMLVIGTIAGHPLPAWGQAGWYVTPTVGASEEFDSNIFAQRSGSESDYISRLSVALTAGYESTPFTLTGQYAADAELFARHPELNNELGRQQAGLRLQYLPLRALTLDLAGSYTQTERPSELNPDTGIQLGRGTTRQVSVSSSASYSFSQILSGRLRYGYTHDTFEGSPATEAHRMGADVQLEVSPFDTATLAYGLDLFDTASETTAGGRDTELSQFVTVGWTRRLTERLTANIAAGPRINESGITPEINAGIRYRLRTGSVGLTFSRTETTVVSQPGTVESNALRVSLSMEPLALLTVNVTSAVQLTTGGSTGDVTVYSAAVSFSYRLTQWLAASLAYNWSLQDDRLGEIQRHIVTLGVNVRYPIRVP